MENFYDDDVVRIETEEPSRECKERLAVLVVRRYNEHGAHEVEIALAKDDVVKLMKVFEE